MATVGVAHLKAHLSAVLARVRAGESVLVTDRGRPVAQIVPVTKTDDADQHLADLARAGLVRVGTRRVPGAYWAMVVPSDPTGKSLTAAIEEREGGW